jgi:hypothetical protein
LVFATAKALAALFCLAANTVRHEYVVVSAAEAWKLCMGATEPHDMAISEIGIGLRRLFMTVSRKPPGSVNVNRITGSAGSTGMISLTLAISHGAPHQQRSPC